MKPLVDRAGAWVPIYNAISLTMMNRCYFAWLVIAAGMLRCAAEEPKQLPAPQIDRVGFPKNYAADYTVLRQFERGSNQVVTVYGNATAAKVTGLTNLPFANGAVLVMETATVALDAAGRRVKGADGTLTKGGVNGLHVMRRGQNFGEAYGALRAGEWEFAEYRADGSYITPPEKSATCAQCHIKAGRDHDFVFRGRLPEVKQ